MTLMMSPPPGGLATPQQLIDFAEAWLNNRRLAERTREEYRRDVREFIAWCEQSGLNPLVLMFTHINTYARMLEASIDPRTGKLLGPATVARKLSAISGWYKFLYQLGFIPRNPVDGADRPKVDPDYTTTVSMTRDEVKALLRAAEAHSPRAFAAVALLAVGLRVSDVLNLAVSGVGRERGHRTIRFKVKGNKWQRRGLGPRAAAALDAYLAVRGNAPGPVFVTRTGKGWDRHALGRLVKELANTAGLDCADDISAHSLKHSFVTNSIAAGASRRRVQHAAGHKNERTTDRYDHDRENLDEDPAYLLEDMFLLEDI